MPANVGWAALRNTLGKAGATLHRGRQQCQSVMLKRWPQRNESRRELSTLPAFLNRCNRRSRHPADFVTLGQEDRKHGSGRRPVRPAAHLDRSTVLLDNAARDPQSEPGPGVLLGG